MKLASKYGLKLNECIPEIVTGKVVRIEKELVRFEYSDQESCEFITKQKITFEIKLSNSLTRATVTFQPGDITPTMGQSARGVLVYNQFGSTVFTPTHLYAKD